MRAQRLNDLLVARKPHTAKVRLLINEHTHTKAVCVCVCLGPVSLRTQFRGSEGSEEPTDPHHSIVCTGVMKWKTCTHQTLLYSWRGSPVQFNNTQAHTVRLYYSAGHQTHDPVKFIDHRRGGFLAETPPESFLCK